MKRLLVISLILLVGCKRYQVVQNEDNKNNAFVTTVVDTKYKDSIVAAWAMWLGAASEFHKKVAYQIANTVAEHLEETGEILGKPDNIDSLRGGSLLMPSLNFRIK